MNNWLRWNTGDRKPNNRILTRTEQEEAEAFELYRIAAEQGVAGAQCRLGVMYAEGRGVTKDHIASAQWFQLAAAQGDAEAQGGLGLAYATGRGVSQDFVASHMWLSLALLHLNGVTRHGALRFRDSISAGMTPDQIIAAERLAQAWTPTLR
jgi:TPR repeat protein